MLKSLPNSAAEDIWLELMALTMNLLTLKASLIPLEEMCPTLKARSQPPLGVLP